MATPQKIKVLHLVTRMNVGGVAVLLDNLMSNIDKDEFEVLLATGLCESPEGEYLENRNIGYQLERIPTFHKSLSFGDDLKSVISIIKLLKEFKPDIVHTHTSKAGTFWAPSFPSNCAKCEASSHFSWPSSRGIFQSAETWNR